MRKVSGKDRLGFPSPGTPIYEAAPILGADRRFEEDEAVVSCCVNTVFANDGDAFFERQNWETTLRRVHDEKSSKPAGSST